MRYGNNYIHRIIRNRQSVWDYVQRAVTVSGIYISLRCALTIGCIAKNHLHKTILCIYIVLTLCAALMASTMAGIFQPAFERTNMEKHISKQTGRIIFLRSVPCLLISCVLYILFFHLIYLDV